LLIGFTLLLLRLLTTRSFGFPYLWPLIPLNLKALPIIFYRRPIPMQLYRPDFLRTRDSDRTGGRR
jgi:stage V sporulation protein AF